MSTHVDGAAPSVAPDPDDGEPDRQPSEFGRRLAVGARGDPAPDGGEPVDPRSACAPWRRGGPAADAPAERGARESPRREPVTPARPGAARRRFRSRLRVRRGGRPARELRPAAFRADPRSRRGACRPDQRADPDRPPGWPATRGAVAAEPRARARRRPVAAAHRGAAAGPQEAQRPRHAAAGRRRAPPVPGRGRVPRSSPASPCSGSVRRPGCSAAPHRCRRGGFRRRRRGASRPRPRAAGSGRRNTARRCGRRATLTDADAGRRLRRRLSTPKTTRRREATEAATPRDTAADGPAVGRPDAVDDDRRRTTPRRRRRGHTPPSRQPSPRTDRPARELSEVTTTILPVVDDR